MANVKPSAFGTAITPAATTILTGETAGGVAGRVYLEHRRRGHDTQQCQGAAYGRVGHQQLDVAAG